MSRVLLLGDTHKPWSRWRQIEAAAKFCDAYDPHTIVQVGDFIDAKAWSVYSKDPSDLSPGWEWELTERAVAKFHKLFEGRRMVILEGNHCRRYMLRALEAGIPRKLVRSLSEVFPIKEWTWQVECGPRPVKIDGVRYMHGDEMEGSHRAWQKAQRLGGPVVQGHDHKGYIEHVPTYEHRAWGMSVGAFLDPTSRAARYAMRNPSTMWHGWATVTDGVPHLHPWSPGRRNPMIRSADKSEEGWFDTFARMVFG